MRKLLVAALLILIAGASIATIFSRDVQRFFTLYANGSSSVLAKVDLAALGENERAAYYFLAGDFGALSTDTLRGSATPWMLTATVVTLDYVDGDRSKLNRSNIAAAYRQWGLTSPTFVANWPQGLDQPDLDGPLGVTIGAVERNLPPIRITAANIGCAACHSSVVYDADGNPDPETVWLGAPNGSINLEGFPQAIYDAFLKYGSDPDLLDMAQTLFPEMTDKERWTLKNFILPAANKRIAELEATIKRAVPFRGGYPGATNGLDSLRLRLGLASRDAFVETSAFNSIPSLEDHAMRTTLLNAANYEIPEVDPQQTLTRADVTPAHLDKLGAIVAYFPVPSMGIDFETAREQIPYAQAAMRFVADYQSPPFPGTINLALAAQGSSIYEKQCASCHGEYEETPNGPRLASFPNYVGDVGSDRLRLNLLTEEFATAVNASPMGDHIHVPDVSGYTAPSLSGAWATAPYLHNASVPTLWSLMNPEERPVAFPVGGHRLDFEKVGLALDIGADGIAAYPEDYAPWSKPIMFDTREKGLSNAGHTEPFDTVAQDDKRALLEYLKSL